MADGGEEVIMDLFCGRVWRGQVLPSVATINL
jgi:hypothetical protein